MIDNAGQETDIAGKEELASAQQLITAMVKTSRALRMYLPNNPVLIGFLEELSAKLTAHLARFGEFNLDVEPFALRYKGSDVYQNDDPKESISCRVYADGIRMLMFSPGVDSHELTAFLGIVGFERSTCDDDVVTRLWERNLPHISYLQEEDFIEAHLEEGLTDAASQQQAISRIYQALPQQPAPPPRMIPKHLLMLTGAEERWLQQATRLEGRRSALDDVINILSAILAGVREPPIFWDFVGIMGNLAKNMFLAGEIGHALRLVRFMDQLLKQGGTLPEQRQLLCGALAGILDEATVHALQETLDGSETVSHEELVELLQIFGLPSLHAICELLACVQKLKLRKVIVEVLVDLGRENPAVFVPFLNDPRWYLVRNMVLVLSLLGTPVALQMIAGLISHKEQRVRREVLGFLERSGDLKAKSYLVKFLRDESGALRIRALQIMARERLRFALNPIMALIGAGDFQDKGLDEKKAVYEALGELGGEQVLPVFRDMLLKRYWFHKAGEKEAVTLAVAGLLKMRGSAGVRLLEEALDQKKSPEARLLLEQALAAVTVARRRRAG